MSLGPEGSYDFISEGGGGNWLLKGHFDELDQTLTILKSLSGVVSSSSIHYPYTTAQLFIKDNVLSPYRDDVYLTLSATGACDATVPTPQLPIQTRLGAVRKKDESAGSGTSSIKQQQQVTLKIPYQRFRRCERHPKCCEWQWWRWTNIREQ
jgi:hypothetical protein